MNNIESEIDKFDLICTLISHVHQICSINIVPWRLGKMTQFIQAPKLARILHCYIIGSL
jgi:hypothetical protein